MNGVRFALLFAVFAAFASGYWFEGDTICFQNQYGKLCQNPHTLTDLNNFVEVSATSFFNEKQELDFAFGFDSSFATPKQAWYWKLNASHEVPTYGAVSRWLQCSGPFNYSLNPKRAWCYDSAENLTLVWERYFMNAWLANATIEWFEWAVNGSQTAYWPDWSPLTQFRVREHAGKNWYVIENVSFENNETKLLRAHVVAQPMTSGKYDVAIKRSSDSWVEAFESGNMVLLDPWWNTSWSYRQAFNLTSYDGKDLTLIPVILNATGLSLATDNCSNEVRVTLNASTEVETQFAVLNDSGQTLTPGSQWCLLHVLVNATTSAPNATHAQLNATTGYVYYYNPYATTDHSTNIRGGTVQTNLWVKPSEEPAAYNWTTQVAYAGTGTNYGALQASGNNEVMYFEAAGAGDNRWAWLRDTAGTNTVTLVTRYKSVNASLVNPATRIFSGTNGTSWEVNATHAIVRYANLTECASVAVANANTAYHEYWLAFDGATGNTKLYVDGVLTVDAACAGASADDRIEFGSMNTPVTGAGYWDFVWFSNGTVLLPLNASFGAEESNATPTGIDFFMNCSDEQTGILKSFNASFTNSTNSTSYTNVSSVSFNTSVLSGFITSVANKTDYYDRTYYFTLGVTNVTLECFLLPTIANAALVRFFVRNTQATPISNAEVSIARQYGGEWKTIGQQKSDSAGGTLFYLEVGAYYRVYVTATGYDSHTSYITASGAEYTITLGGVGGYANFTTLWGGIRYFFLPTSPYLFATTLNFSLWATGDDLDFSGWFLHYGNGTILNWTNSTNSSGSSQAFTVALAAGENLTAAGFFKRSDFGTNWINRTFYHANFSAQNSSLNNTFAYIAASTAGTTGLGIMALLLLVLLMAWVVRMGGPSGAGVIAVVVLGILTFLGFISWQLFALTAIAAFGVMYLNRGI